MWYSTSCWLVELKSENENYPANATVARVGSQWESRQKPRERIYSQLEMSFGGEMGVDLLNLTKDL